MYVVQQNSPAVDFLNGSPQIKKFINAFYFVGIADTYLSPLSRECDELFLASTESTSFGASYAAPISLLNAILAACAQYRRPHTLALLKEIAEEQRKGFRWHSN